MKDEGKKRKREKGKKDEVSKQVYMLLTQRLTMTTESEKKIKLTHVEQPF